MAQTTIELAELQQLREDAERYRWLKQAMEKAHEDGPIENDEPRLYVSCATLVAVGRYRTIKTDITFADLRDEPLGLDAAIDAARAANCLKN